MTSLRIILISKLVFLLCVISFSAPVYAQSPEQNSTYLSPVDEALTIRKIVLIPVTDNVNGIYSRPIENKISDSIEKNHHWELAKPQSLDGTPSPSDLEDRPEQVKKIATDSGAEALIAAKVNRGPDGINIEVALFMKFDGHLFAKENAKALSSFNVTEVQGRALELVQRVLSRIPYQGLILSRDGTRVTINLGTKDGVTKDQMLTAAQIIKLNRHPKFHFMVGAEKELVGKIKVEKVEETLSFGSIVTEKERGVIRKNTKISGLDFVAYNESGFTPGAPVGKGIDEQSAQNLIFGKDAREWVPVKPPSFGRVTMLAGLGNFTLNSTTENPPLNMTANKMFYLNLKLGAELWITPAVIVDGGIKQGVFTAENPRSGSSPSQINVATSNYHLKFGYNFLITDDFYGPKITLLAGFAQYSLFVDTTSPLAFTSTSYRGLDFGIKGSFPIDEKRIWQLGAAMDLILAPAVSETPQSSGGSASNTVMSYSVFAIRKMSERIEAVGSLDFELYSSQFASGGTRPETGVTTSQRITTLFGGINYLF